MEDLRGACWQGREGAVVVDEATGVVDYRLDGAEQRRNLITDASFLGRGKMKSTWLYAIRAKREIIFATALLMLFVGVPVTICEWYLHNYQSSKGGCQTLGPKTVTKLIVRLDRQKEQHSQWAYVALSAIVAVSVVKRTFKIPWVRPAYVLLGTAGALLLESIRAGQLYESVVTGLTLRGTLSERDFYTINGLLWWQIQWLSYAAFTLLLFVGIFIVAVLSGKVDFNDEETEL